MVTQDLPVLHRSLSFLHFKDISVLHVAGKLTCVVSIVVSSALLWEGVRVPPARSLKPPADRCFLAAHSLCHS